MIVWKATDTPLAVPVAITTGALIDGDHVLDFLDWFIRGRRKHMLVLLHAWEYLAVVLGVLAFWHHPIYMAAALGYASHVIADHLANPTYPLAYSITYRIYRRFKAKWLVYDEPRLVPKGEVPLWGHIEPWLWRRLYLLRHSNKASQTTRQPDVVERGAPEPSEGGSD